MKLNTGTTTLKTHEGATAYHLDPERQLRRLTMACLLWEDTFYIDGKSHVDLIAAQVPLCKPESVMQMAIEARNEQKLRHVPLLLAREMCRHKTHRKFVAKTLEAIIQRPDELAEFLLLYDPKYSRDHGGKGQPLAAQVKKGLAKAFAKFDAYALAKYDRSDAKVRLKDVLFFAHAKPKDGSKGMTRGFRKAASAGEVEARISDGGLLFKKLVEDGLPLPGTWENELSEIGQRSELNAEEKKALVLKTWERLIGEKKLGALALLRNLRNMKEAGVSRDSIAKGLAEMKTDRVLPFRFIAAAQAAPEYEPMLEPPFFRCAEAQEKLAGRTAIVVDISGSMDDPLSGKSKMKRMDAASALAMLLREQTEDVIVIAFTGEAVIVPARRGFALRDAIVGALPHGSTMTKTALNLAKKQGYDRIVLITDEQPHTDYPEPLPGSKAYVINVGTYQNGLGYGRWTHIDGFSEATVRFILTLEKEEGS